MSTTHVLKTWPVHFQRSWEGEKPYEVRLDDRGYQKGDLVVLREWDHKERCSCPNKDQQHDDATCRRYSGREIRGRVGHVMASTPSLGNRRGFVGHGYVVFSVLDVELVDGRAARAEARSLISAREAFGRIAAAGNTP